MVIDKYDIWVVGSVVLGEKPLVLIAWFRLGTFTTLWNVWDAFRFTFLACHNYDTWIIGEVRIALVRCNSFITFRVLNHMVYIFQLLGMGKLLGLP